MCRAIHLVDETILRVIGRTRCDVMRAARRNRGSAFSSLSPAAPPPPIDSYLRAPPRLIINKVQVSPGAYGLDYYERVNNIECQHVESPR